MNMKSIILVASGLLLLIVGGYMEFAGTAPKADVALAQKCRDEMTRRDAGTDMVKQCDEVAFATAATATDAATAARSISAANNGEVASHSAAMFMLGLGLVLVIGGSVIGRANLRS